MDNPYLLYWPHNGRVETYHDRDAAQARLDFEASWLLASGFSLALLPLVYTRLELTPSPNTGFPHTNDG